MLCGVRPHIDKTFKIPMQVTYRTITSIGRISGCNKSDIIKSLILYTSKSIHYINSNCNRNYLIFW